MLYRPFVHYITRSEEKSFAIATACVNVSRKIVHTTDEMRRSGLLNGAYWFTIYTTFFAIITLIYYVLVNPPDKTSRAILGDIKMGKDCLISLQDKSAAAHRCLVALNVNQVFSTHLVISVLTSLQPLFEKAFERINNAPAPAKLAPSKTKRARALSGVANAEGEEGQSPTFLGHSSPGTISPTESATQSPAHRVIATPISPTEGNKRLSTSLNVFGTKFTISPDLAIRRRSYDLYQTADYSAQSSDSSVQQLSTTSMGFQAHVASNGMPDLNAMVFPTNDLFSFVPHMGPTIQRSNTKGGQASQMNPPIYPSVSDGNSFGNLEGNILGPLPPYLLQGQQPLMGDYGLGSGTQSQGQRNGIDASMSGQFFMSSGGGGDDTMVHDFFRDDWDATLTQHTFRSA